MNGGKGLKDVTNIDGKNKCQAIPTPGSSTAATSGDDEDSSDEKERHSSGESVDSALSFSLSSVASGGISYTVIFCKHVIKVQMS